jgi:hypothetical protein
MQPLQKAQKAIYTLLSAQSPADLENITGIFHYIPQKTNFPYIHISEGKCEEISDFKNAIFKLNIKINVFDRNKSNIRVMTLCDKLSALLLNIETLNLDNYFVLDGKHKGCDISLKQDGETWKGELIFEFIVKQ